MRLSKKIKMAMSVSDNNWFKVPIHLRDAIVKKKVKAHIKKVNSKK